MTRFGVKLASGFSMAIFMAAIVGSTIAEDKKVLSIKECMKVQKTAVTDIDKQLKAKEVNWDKVETAAKNWSAAATDLCLDKPKKGDEKSWKEQSEKYAATVKAVGDAAEKKDADTVKAKLKQFGASCGGCHSKHKG